MTTRCRKPTQVGTKVEYTSKAGRTATYVVLEKKVDEVMYGPMKGSTFYVLRLGRDQNDNGFWVRRSNVVVVQNTDDKAS